MRKHVYVYSNETRAWLLVSWAGMDLSREDAEAAGMMRRLGGTDAFCGVSEKNMRSVYNSARRQRYEEWKL